jgi:hypothetical protein
MFYRYCFSLEQTDDIICFKVFYDQIVLGNFFCLKIIMMIARNS